MAKSKETLNIENLLFIYNKFNSFFCIFECTIGFGGGGRVDCISIDTRSCIRCFEIKVTKSDFHSKHGHNFVGNLNYYVMPKKLYEEVKNEIPNEIGVMCPNKNNDNLNIIKKSKSIECKFPKNDLKLYIIRSLFREYSKSLSAENKDVIKYYEKQIRTLKKQNEEYYNMLKKLNNKIRVYLGKNYSNFKNYKI